jgi:hypothetical protein
MGLFSTTISTPTMDNVVDWVFFYPDPDYARGVLVTTPYPYSGRIGHLWKLAKAEDPNLAEKIGKAELMFYVVRSSFFNTTGAFSHIYSSRPTCL